MRKIILAVILMIVPMMGMPILVQAQNPRVTNKTLGTANDTTLFSLAGQKTVRVEVVGGDSVFVFIPDEAGTFSTSNYISLGSGDAVSFKYTGIKFITKSKSTSVITIYNNTVDIIRKLHGFSAEEAHTWTGVQTFDTSVIFTATNLDTAYEFRVVKFPGEEPNIFFGQGGKLMQDTSFYGAGNISIGLHALRDFIKGSYNIGIGHGVFMKSTASFLSNVGIGSLIGPNLITANGVGLLGYDILKYATYATGSQLLGTAIMRYVDSSYINVGIGSQLMVGSTGYSKKLSYNVAVGSNIMYRKRIGDYNSIYGHYTLYNDSSGIGNTISGYEAMRSSYNGNYNTVSGYGSLYNLNGSSYNIGLGFNSGKFLLNGSSANTRSQKSIYIGADTKSKTANDSNQIVIGYGALGNGTNTVTIGNADITNTYLYGTVSSTANATNDLGSGTLAWKDAYIHGYIYLAGNESTDGSWRFSAGLGGDMIFEYRVSGVWTEKSRITK